MYCICTAQSHFVVVALATCILVEVFYISLAQNQASSQVCLLCWLWIHAVLASPFILTVGPSIYPLLCLTFCSVDVDVYDIHAKHFKPARVTMLIDVDCCS